MIVINSAGVVNSIPDRLNDGRYYYNVMRLKEMDIRILCPICKKEFYSVNQYYEHMRKHKKEELAKNEKTEKIEVTETPVPKRGRPKKEG